MSLRQEFRSFLFRGNVVDLAVAVVVGAAFSKIVTAFVDDLVMPLVGALLPAGGWREFTVTPLHFKLGHFMGSLVDFVVIAVVIFMVLVKFLGSFTKKEAAPPPPATKPCGECLELIPAAAKRCRACTAVVAALLLLLFAPSASAADPKFEFGKPPEPKPTEWRAQAKGGLLATGGNSQTIAGSLGGLTSHQKGSNRFTFEGALAYARANILTAADSNMNGLLEDGELFRTSNTTSNSWQVRERYDRFFTTNNSGYVSTQSLRDRPAGKELNAGAQIGYSRQLIKNDRHRAVAEVGYDFSYEKATAPGATGVAVHSGRLFVAEALGLSPETGITVSVEVLSNLNKEKAPAPGYDEVDALKDTRVAGKLGLTTTLWKNLSFGFGVTLRYDDAPAPLPAPKGSPPFDPAFHPLAKTLDFITEASLIVTLF